MRTMRSITGLGAPAIRPIATEAVTFKVPSGPGSAAAAGVLLKTSVEGTRDPHPARPKDAAAHRSTTAGSAKRRIATPCIVPPKRVNMHRRTNGTFSPIAHRLRSVKLHAASFSRAELKRQQCDKQSAAGFMDTAYS